MDAAKQRFQELVKQLNELHGPLMSGEPLRKALGFRTDDALRMAIRRGTVPVEVFKLPNRRGRFARTVDVAAWLATAGKPTPQEEDRAMT